jgi:threonine/homoserine/homoserine lactone efflux protein
MIIALLAGLIIGFVLAIPPGPVGVTTIRLSIDKGIRHSTLSALGTGLMDFIYCLLVIFATSAILKLVNGFFDKYPILLLGFQISVVVLVIIYGIVNIKFKNNVINRKKSKSKPFKFISKLSSRGPFLLGIAVAIANVANPTFLAALAYITVNVQKFVFPENTVQLNVIFAFAFGVGNFLWLYVLSRILIHYKDKMSTQALARIHQFAGITLIGFGTILGYRVVTVTHWGEIMRYVFAF